MHLHTHANNPFGIAVPLHHPPTSHHPATAFRIWRRTCLVEGDVVLAGVEGLRLAVDIEVAPPAAGVVMRTVIPDVGDAPAA